MWVIIALATLLSSPTPRSGGGPRGAVIRLFPVYPWTQEHLLLNRGKLIIALTFLALLRPGRSCADDGATPPVLPVGLDAYRMWDCWPRQRIGERGYMRSTYDRQGGNEGADASHFLYQVSDDFNVTLDVRSAGILYFARFNHWHGSPWHFVVDGSDHLVRETGTDDPEHPRPDAVFEPHGALPRPLAWTWADTRGADLTWVPVGFEKSFQMAYTRTHYGTGYYIYHQFAAGAKLSQPIRHWDASTPQRDVLDLINRSGSDLTEGLQDLRSDRGRVDVPAGTPVNVLEMRSGPRMIRALTLSAPAASAVDLAGVRLRVWWDRRTEPSIDAPLPLFFGAGTLYNRDGREFLVKAFATNVRFVAGRVNLACYFPMPFFQSARIELAGGDTPVRDVQWSIKSAALRDPPNSVGYFHATYRDHPNPVKGEDLVLLDTRQVEGGGDWSGSFVGTSFIFSHAANLNTLEGDPRFYFDDSLTPQAQGTGTEEWAGGGDYWGGQNMTLPFAGHPCGARSAKDAKNELDKIESAYRFLLADLFPFGRNARITLEHGGTDESSEHYETVTYWYGLPAPSLIRTDELSIGDPGSEKEHAYQSPDASPPYELSSRYEWGVDALQGREVYPARLDRGRTTRGTSEFTLRIDPNNFGVLLRRKLDYQFPNQCAQIWVADAETPADAGTWKPAGVWYLAGSNTCVYSNPREELGKTAHNFRTSNRRFRDDEFLIGSGLTRGKKALRVRVKFTPVRIPLFEGHPQPQLAWSEMRYTGYCWVVPAPARR